MEAQNTSMILTPCPSTATATSALFLFLEALLLVGFNTIEDWHRIFVCEDFEDICVGSDDMTNGADSETELAILIYV